MAAVRGCDPLNFTPEATHAVQRLADLFGFDVIEAHPAKTLAALEQLTPT